jgi:hypothetical protein
MIELTELFNEKIDAVLWVITACSGSSRAGLVATFVCNASLVPVWSKKSAVG